MLCAILFYSNLTQYYYLNVFRTREKKKHEKKWTNSSLRWKGQNTTKPNNSDGGQAIVAKLRLLETEKRVWKRKVPKKYNMVTAERYLGQLKYGSSIRDKRTTQGQIYCSQKLMKTSFTIVMYNVLFIIKCLSLRCMR